MSNILKIVLLGLVMWVVNSYGQTRQAGRGNPSQDTFVLEEMYRVVQAKIDPRYPQQELITSEKAKLFGESGKAVLVDVRQQEERNVSKLPGAISQVEFEENLQKYEGQLVIFYCTIGWRSGDWAHKYQELGWKTMNLRGGILEWSHFGYSFVNPQGDLTDSVHVYSSSWNYLNSQYFAVE